MITAALREKIRQQAGNRCGYCRAQQEYVLNILEIDHILPMAAGGDDSEENLWLACRACNNAKGAKIAAIDPLTKESLPLFNPRKQNWREHFSWSRRCVYRPRRRNRANQSRACCGHVAAVYDFGAKNHRRY